MKKAISRKQDMTPTQKIKERRRAKEANARRKVNEDWQRMESTGKYRKAVAREAGWNTTNRIANEVLDGIFLSLNARNEEKSSSEQKKLLRRIVEKRQAQAVHAIIRKDCDRKTVVTVITNTSKRLERLHHRCFAC